MAHTTCITKYVYTPQKNTQYCTTRATSTTSTTSTTSATSTTQKGTIRPNMSLRFGDEFYHKTQYYGFKSAKKSSVYDEWLLIKNHQCKMRVEFCVANFINVSTDIIYKNLENKPPPHVKQYINRSREITESNMVYPLKNNKNLDILLRTLKKGDPNIEYCGVVVEL